MNAPTVDLLLAGPEASWITRSLEEVGVEVRLSSGVGPDSAALIIDRNHEALIDNVRSCSGVCVVVGWEPLSADEEEAIGPHTFFQRPVPIARLVQTLRSAFGLASSTTAAPRREATVHLVEDDEDPPQRMPTVQLDDGALSVVVRVDADAQKEEPDQARSSTGALDAPEASRPPEAGVDTLELSPHLNELLRAADRRLFPGEEPLDLRFAVGEEDVHELVPDELLAEVALPLDVRTSADPLEAFTFVGTPDLLDTASGRRTSSPGTPHTVAGLSRARLSAPEISEKSDSRSGSTSNTDLTREGLLPPGGAMRMFWQLRQSRGAELRFEIPGGATVTFMLRHGELVDMRGDLHMQLARQLRSEGLVREMTESEDEAQQAVQRAIDGHRLSVFEAERRLRLLRERRIGELCQTPECRYMLSEAQTTEERVLLGKPVTAVAADRLRARLGATDALRWLGVERSSLLWLSSGFAAAAREMRFEPELVLALEHHAGSPVGNLLSDMAATAGAAGALFALASADALRFEAGEAAITSGKRLRARVERAHALALEGDYFRILGIPRNATTREVAEAHQLQVRAIAHLDLHALGLGELEGPRQEALEAIEDAFEVLRDEGLRRVYGAGLG